MRLRTAAACGVIGLALAACAHAPAPEAASHAQGGEPLGWGVVIHGGSGGMVREDWTAEEEARLRAVLGEAAMAAAEILEQGGSSLDAVEAAIRLLEDDDAFNAGRGAVFTAEGRNELDASIMDGRTRDAGAVAGVTVARNPITLARAVMERSPHVMMAADGADQFARVQGVELVDPSYFATERRWRSLLRALDAFGAPAPAPPAGHEDWARLHDPDADFDHYGTVGAVALDQNGHLAAGTSTGGMTAKLYGRVGDSPVIGAGTYADDASCAVSATGHGEFFIRAAVARTICARVELLGEDLQTAADAVVQTELVEMGGEGGVIAVDGSGALVWSFNSPGMFRARAGEGRPLEVGIFSEAEEARAR